MALLTVFFVAACSVVRSLRPPGSAGVSFIQTQRTAKIRPRDQATIRHLEQEVNRESATIRQLEREVRELRNQKVESPGMVAVASPASPSAELMQGLAAKIRSVKSLPEDSRSIFDPQGGYQKVLEGLEHELKLAQAELREQELEQKASPEVYLQRMGKVQAQFNTALNPPVQFAMEKKIDVRVDALEKKIDVRVDALEKKIDAILAATASAPPASAATASVQFAEPLELLHAWKPWAKDQRMKVVYGVFTSPLPKYAQQMQAVIDTWANDVPPQKLLVVGVNGTAPGVTYKQAPMCPDGHVTNPGISCKEATLLTTGYKLGADWVVVVGSDNYVFPRNFEERLAREDANKAQILAIWGCGGGAYCEDHKSGLCGGGGYAISRAALDKMVGDGKDASRKFIQESMQTASTVGGYWSDQVTSCIARRRGVKEVDLTGLYGWKVCPRGAMVCAFDEAAYKDKITSTNPKTLTFHYIDPKDMRTIHKMKNDLLGSSRKATDKSMFNQVSTFDGGDYASSQAAYIKMVDKERARQRSSEPGV